MLGAVLHIIGYILLGAAMIVGAVFGAAWFVAKEINKGHGEGCSCPACQARRQRQWRSRHPAANESRTAGPWVMDRKPPHSGSRWVSTHELQPGMKVIGKGSQKIFRVEAVYRIGYEDGHDIPAGEHRTGFGYMVVLINALTNTRSEIPVRAEVAHHRIWLVRRPKGDVK